jgi:hypothetical protein
MRGLSGVAVVHQYLLYMRLWLCDKVTTLRNERTELRDASRWCKRHSPRVVLVVDLSGWKRFIESDADEGLGQLFGERLENEKTAVPARLAVSGRGEPSRSSVRAPT